MATMPKALELNDEARRAYVPAPHHDQATPSTPEQTSFEETPAVAAAEEEADAPTQRAAPDPDAPEDAADEDDEDDEDDDEDEDGDDEDEDEEDDEEAVEDAAGTEAEEVAVEAPAPSQSNR